MSIENSTQFEYKVDIFRSELQKILGTSGVAQKFSNDIIKIMIQIWGKETIMVKNNDLINILDSFYRKKKDMIDTDTDTDLIYIPATSTSSSTVSSSSTSISNHNPFMEVCKGITKEGNPCRSNHELINGYCKWHKPSCKGITLKNTKCKITIDLDENGYCHHHKGQFHK